MRKKWIIGEFVFLLIFGASVFPALAGDSIYGTVTEVKSAALVVLDYGNGQYNIRIIGIDVPQETASEAKQFVSALVLGKKAGARLGSRAKNGDMVCQLFSDDPVNGIKDVGWELVRAGLARRQKGEDYQFGYPYGDLAKAEREARDGKRGLWKKRK